ncbi:MAG: nuclear transport factor 2 family protein [Chitinophagales bacterium]
MKRIFFIATGCMLLFACNNKKTEEPKTTGTTVSEKKPATEILDLSAADPITKSLAAFSKGDLDGMTADYDDNVRYTWSSGDSAIGKKAVKAFYAGRWKLIDSISFSNDIKLPIQVNESQQPQVAPPGKWVLYWVMTNVKYKNGKRLTFWQHSVNHFNDAGKIDFVGLYLDRQPIMEATKGMNMK